tara:strand:- start:3732 stop:4769 length:1038 start_codon:yes stop_codon:yes gene_type:complete
MQMNSTSAKIYREALRLIRADIEHSGHLVGFYTRRVCPSAKPAIYVRQQQPEGLPGVVFEVAPSAVKPLRLAQATKGFVVSTELTVDASGRKVCCVAVSLNDASFEELFSELVGHLLDHVIASVTERDSMISLQAQLQLWRKFLDRGADDGLSENEQTGLYGELSFVRLCMEAGMPAVDLLNAWTGPTGTNQDFTFGACAVEVKSSSSNDANRIRISNLRQLDDTGLDELYLQHYAFDRRQSAAGTLPELVGVLLGRFQADDVALNVLFDERLIAAGYFRSHEALYRETGYTERYSNTYGIREGFPRILEADICLGISDVKFVVDLASAKDYRIDVVEVLRECEG